MREQESPMGVGAGVSRGCGGRSLPRVLARGPCNCCFSLVWMVPAHSHPDAGTVFL